MNLKILWQLLMKKNLLNEPISELDRSSNYVWIPYATKMD